MLADFVRTLIQQQAGEADPVLHLFDGPFVTVGARRVDIPEGSKRLLVFAALHGGRTERRYAANALWPVGGDVRAAGNLRSALWRLNGTGIQLLAVDTYRLALREGVLVDARLVSAWAGRIIDDAAKPGDLNILPGGIDSLDMLPAWYDDWALVERERVRQRLLQALEAISRQLVRLRRYAEAVEAAMTAVSAEPLRESAQRVLIEAHLAEGNWIEGRRTLHAYRAVLDRDLGTEPSPDLAALLRTAAR